MADKIPVRYLPDEEAQPAFGEMRPGDTTPVVHGGTGATTPEAARLNLGIVDAPGSVTEYPYTMELPSTVTPTTGNVSRDTEDPTTTSVLYIHKLDGDGVDQTAFLSSLKAGDWVNLFQVADPAIKEQYDATGPAAANGSVYEVPVSPYANAGALVNGDACHAYWRIAQDPVDWGEIQGTLSDQTDLQAALDAKPPEPADDGNPKLRQTAAGVSAWVASGSSAVLNVGQTTGQVAAGDDNRFPTADEKDALTNNSTLNAGNPVASMADAEFSSDDSVADIVTLTQAEYDLLAPPVDTTLYLICG